MKRHLLVITLALLFLTACQQTDHVRREAGNYIVAVDYAKFFEGITNLSEEQGAAINMQISNELWDNTVGKEIPDIMVTDPEGKRYSLKKLLCQGAIIIFSAHNSGWGKVEAETEFPALIREISDELDGIDILCLVENSKSYDQKMVNDYVWRLQKEYSKVYLIDQSAAKKMNLIACPTKLFVNKAQTVSYIHAGYAMESEARINLIRAGINEINKEKI